VTKPLMALLAALATLALVAGCGGGSDSNSSTEATAASPTKAEFLKQGNAICAKGNKEIGEGFEEFGKEHGFSKQSKPTQPELEEAAEEILIPKIRQELDGIRALGAPSGEEAEVEAILAAAEEGLEKGEEDPGAMIEEGEGPFAKANKLSREYGLVKCGEEEGEEG
jgi:hypothetical protein